jgi:hypothetical protein
MSKQPSVAWEPQPGPQTELIRCPVFETFFGGARGGGKTDGVLGEFASHAAQHAENAIGLMVRRERTQLIETIERSRMIYPKVGAHFNEQDKMWRFPNGARLRFAYLERDSDADAYQGHSYTRVYPEEVGTFPSPKPIMKLMATLRSGAGVPCRLIATGNPGGPGHQWVRARYIDPAPHGWKIIKEPYRNPWSGKVVERERVFIPSKITDNRFISDDYVANLQMVGSQTLVRAWLEGDWSVIEGAFFHEFSGKHVIRPFEIPANWTRFRAMDWGSARPFSVGWYAISDGLLPGIPRGALIKYREWYGMKEGQPNVGLKMVAEEVADGIKRREEGEQINFTHSVIDPSAFHQDGGPSIAERMWRRGVKFRAADNKRTGKSGALGGWDQLRARLVGEEGDRMSDGSILSRPMIYFFSTCVHTIRTLPALQHDEAKPEDVDTEGEDHAADETRYACMSRPFVRDQEKRSEAKPLHEVTLQEFWDAAEEEAATSRRI